MLNLTRHFKQNNVKFYSKHHNRNNNYTYNQNYNNNNKSLAIIPVDNKIPKYDIDHMFEIINNKKLSHIIKIKILQTYCSIMKDSTNNMAQKTVYEHYYNNIINNTKPDSDIEMIDDILSREEPIRKILLDYYEEIQELGKKNDEYKKRLDWIKYALKIPTKYKNFGISDHDKLKEIRTKIDKEIYQMDSVKDDLLSIIYNYATNPKSTHNSVALYGPPGTGKTHLVRCFAEHANIPFIQISVGNINDASYLIGSSYTYIHSQPGYIVQSIIRSGFKNGIIFLDEIDKISMSDRGSEVLGTMMHLCDFTQNSTFEDKYLGGIPIDMSKYLFVYSLNDIDKMNRALLSRIGQNLIKIADYTITDKIIIAENFIIPKLLNELNISETSINFSHDIISYIITDCIPIATKGIRELKGIIYKIIRLVKYYHKINPIEFTFPLLLTKNIINNILHKNDSKLSTKKYIL
jgi:ATP-dependent Lon protease